MPTLKIDGREVTVDRGKTVLEAAADLGIEIPTFCYHPGLSRPANCRMCLVDIQGRPDRPPPKPIPACYTQVSDGMEIFTDNERVKAVRKHVLEFILLNHPVDCPICDQAGECVLQDHYFGYSTTPSRLAGKKVHKPKVKVLGPDVVLDAERCITCTRCVRFCDEIAKQPQLEVVNRGERSEITTFPGEQLDNPYAGNVVDICPVGALTSRDFRFRTRVWFLQSHESVCPECERGCRVRVDTYENVPRRVKPLHNPHVNDWWMCDAGRGAFKNAPDGTVRMEGPLVDADGKRGTVHLADALDRAADILEQADAGKVAVIVTPWLTNEDALVVGRLLTEGLAGTRVFLGGRPEGFSDDILIRPDKNPNRRGVTEIFSALGLETQPLSALSADGLGAVVVVGDEHGLDEVHEAALAKAEERIVIGSRMSPLWHMASVFLPARVHLEKNGTFTNCDGIVQRIYQAVRPAGTCKSEGWYALKLAQALGADLGYASPDAIFSDLTARVPAFAGLTYEALVPFGARLGASAPVASAPRPVSPAPPAAAPLVAEEG